MFYGFSSYLIKNLWLIYSSICLIIKKYTQILYHLLFSSHKRDVKKLKMFTIKRWKCSHDKIIMSNSFQILVIFLNIISYFDTAGSLYNPIENNIIGKMWYYYLTFEIRFEIVLG